MSEELNVENGNSENTEEVSPLDDSSDSDAVSITLEDYYSLQSESEKKDAIIKQLHARLKKKPTTEKQTLQSNTAVSPQWQERIELKTDGYNDNEISFIQNNGGRKALENEYVKMAIESMRTKARAEAGQVDVDSGKSDIEKQHTEEQLKNMPLADLEKLLPKA